jgi:hypothetical protein
MNKLVEVARKDLGKKEKPGNSGFEDHQLEKDMLAVGWSYGWAWCSCILEKWVWEAFPDLKDKVKGMFVPSAVNTFRNLVRAGYKPSMTPAVGALVFWQKIEDGEPKWMGHTGVVSEVIDNDSFKSIEGNTSKKGSRNGEYVLENARNVNPNVQNGLKVIGFITM